jgi:hypothetical protein
MSFAEKWIELEIVMLSKISQAQKAMYHMFLQMVVIMIMMGYECIWGAFLEGISRKEKGKDSQR